MSNWQMNVELAKLKETLAGIAQVVDHNAQATAAIVADIDRRISALERRSLIWQLKNAALSLRGLLSPKFPKPSGHSSPGSAGSSTPSGNGSTPSKEGTLPLTSQLVIPRVAVPPRPENNGGLHG